jgi:transposase-like protein
MNADTVDVSCPYCGEEAELAIDADGGARQRFVYDCPVCCQPWQVDLTRDRDGDWSASVKTSDE